MNTQILKWFVNLAMGIVSLSCFLTGFFTFTILTRAFGLADIILPLTLMSDIHDWSGITLCLLILVHLVLNCA